MRLYLLAPYTEHRCSNSEIPSSLDSSDNHPKGFYSLLECLHTSGTNICRGSHNDTPGVQRKNNSTLGKVNSTLGIISGTCTNSLRPSGTGKGSNPSARATSGTPSREKNKTPTTQVREVRSPFEEAPHPQYLGIFVYRRGGKVSDRWQITNRRPNYQQSRAGPLLVAGAIGHPSTVSDGPTWSISRMGENSNRLSSHIDLTFAKKEPELQYPTRLTESPRSSLPTPPGRFFSGATVFQ